jgi:hypothetical protein
MAANSDVDPLRQLGAIMMVTTSGNEEAARSVERLATMQRRLARQPKQVAILGSRSAVFVAGRSNDGMEISEVEQSERSAHRLGHHGLLLQLSDVHTFGRPGVSDFIRSPSPSLEYDSHDQSQDPRLVRVHHGYPIRVASNAQAVRTYQISGGREGYPSGDDFRDRSMEVAGMYPVVAYGESAVTAVLKRLAQVSGSANYYDTKNLSKGDLAATAVNLMLDPANVIGRGVVRPTLLESFHASVGWLIESQVSLTRIDGRLAVHSTPTRGLSRWPASATKSVMQYLGAENEVASIARLKLATAYAETSHLPSEQITTSTELITALLGEVFGITIDPEFLATATRDDVKEQALQSRPLL